MNKLGASGPAHGGPQLKSPASAMGWVVLSLENSHLPEGPFGLTATWVYRQREGLVPPLVLPRVIRAL